MSTLMQDPEYQQLLRRREEYWETLKVLLEEWCWITSVLNPQLRCEYEALFGDLERQLQMYATRYLRLQRFAELLIQHRQRGTPLTPQLILSIQRTVLRADAGETTTSPPPPPSSESNHHRQLYLQLVKVLHPDVTGKETPEYRKYWDLVQKAYREGNTSLLQSLLALIVDRNASLETPSSLDTLRSEVATLQCRITYYRKKLEQLKAEVPYRWKDCLQDPQWQQQHRAALQEEIAEVQHRLQTLQRQLQHWLGDQHLLQWQDLAPSDPAFQDQFVTTTYLRMR